MHQLSAWSRRNEETHFYCRGVPSTPLHFVRIYQGYACSWSWPEKKGLHWKWGTTLTFLWQWPPGCKIVLNFTKQIDSLGKVHTVSLAKCTQPSARFSFFPGWKKLHFDVEMFDQKEILSWCVLPWQQVGGIVSKTSRVSSCKLYFWVIPKNCNKIPRQVYLSNPSKIHQKQNFNPCLWLGNLLCC